jgi:GntR family transcriptional regulator
MNIGLVCLTSKFAERVIKSINNVGIKYRKIEFTTTRKTDELKKLINSSDILIVSPGRKKEIERLITKKIPLIEFIYVPDKGSIETLKKNIFDIKKKEVIYNK